MANNNEQLALPELNNSVGMLDSLYAEAFFGKMAEYGHVPQTQEDAIGMLETAYQLDMVSGDEETQKVAAAQHANYSHYANANNSLKEVLSSAGYGPSHQEVEQNGIKQAAYALAQDPNLYSSVLTVKAAEAEAIEQLSQEAAR